MSFAQYLVGIQEPSRLRMVYGTPDIQDALNYLLDAVCIDSDDDFEYDLLRFSGAGDDCVLVYYVDLLNTIYVIIDTHAKQDRRKQKPNIIKHMPMVDWFQFLEYVLDRYSNKELQHFIVNICRTYHTRESILNGTIKTAASLFREIDYTLDLLNVHSYRAAMVLNTLASILTNYTSSTTYPSQYLGLDDILIKVEWQDGE